MNEEETSVTRPESGSGGQDPLTPKEGQGRRTRTDDILVALST